MGRPIEGPPGFEICALATWRHRCVGHLEWHHGPVNKGKLMKNPEAQRFVNIKHPELFLVQVCHCANVTRLADSKEAQAIILNLKMIELGPQRVLELWEEFSELWTSDLPSVEAILMHLPPDAPRPVVQ
jgi:hypothetical protein